MKHIPNFPLQVFYDGSCVVCALEIERYRLMDRSGRLEAVDMSAAGFDPSPWGVTREDLMRELYAIDCSGTIFRGIDAFTAIWQAFPDSTFLKLMVTMIRLPVLSSLARFGYRLFARIRRYLPKRTACAGGNCRIGH